MKKLLSLLMILALTLSLAACGNGNSQNTPPDGDENNKPETEALPFALVVSDGTANLADVMNSITAITGKVIPHSINVPESDDHELLFGSTGHAASLEAAAALEALTAADGDDSCGYIIYKAKNGDVAVYWDNTIVLEDALARFIEGFSDIVALDKRPAGILANQLFSEDEYITNKQWAALEEQAPADVVAALKKLNSFYDGTAIAEWMANLYDPFICVCKQCDPESGELACYGGAFYFSNSARDYSGFLPDAESTVQLLRWMYNNGALANYSGYAEAMPESVKNNLVKFAQSLQDPDDGYFYHPQWGKNIQTDRKGRDLGWATGIISEFGAKPLYPTATERLEGKGSAALLTAPLGVDAATAVSAVLPMASAFEEALKSEETYMAWLIETTKGDDMFINSAGAHTINASKSQIVAAGYLNITLDYLDAQQEKLFKEQKAAYDADPVNNPMPTGLWQRTADYDAVWGLLKFAALYNREIKYAEYGIRTCIAAIKIDAEEGMPYYMNDVYNQWQGASNLIANAKKHNPSIVPTLYELLNADAAAMIENSINKVKKFKCDDGGFSYRMDKAPPAMYGAPTAMGVKESDVNATSLASSMYRAIFSCLGYNDVPLCDYRDGEMFIEIISAATPIEKILRASADPFTFDEKPTAMAETFNGGECLIVPDPKNPDNNVLKYISTPDTSSGDNLKFQVYEESPDANCYVFEMDMMLESANQQVVYQPRIANDKNSLYMIEVLYNKDDGTVSVYENPSTSNGNNRKPVGITAKLGEWFNVRIEYYVDDTNPTIKIYSNGKLVHVSNTFFGSQTEGAKPKSGGYTIGNLMALRAADAVSYVDNVFCGKLVKEYVEETPELD